MTGVYILIAVAVLMLIERRHETSRRNAEKEKLKSQWGMPVTKEIPTEVYETIPHYFEHTKTADVIDDITWHDLDMDRVFLQMNHTSSSVGREYLYRLLRTPSFDMEELSKRDMLMEAVTADEQGRIFLQTQFSELGCCRKYALSDYIDFLVKAPAGSSLIHAAQVIALILSILLMIFVNSTVGAIAGVVVLAYNVISYYRYKAQIEPFFISIKYVAAMAKCCAAIAERKLSYLDNEKFAFFGKLFQKDLRRLWWISSGSDYNGSLIDTLFDYVRMITHVDIMMYNSMIRHFQEKQDDIMKMTELLGFTEAMIAAASYRCELSYYTKPVLTKQNKAVLSADELYHPLVENPVFNSIHTQDCILVTGSNASGKSTFLRTVAVNAILAQTIYTCTAKKYEASFYRIYSSMALSDDLLHGDSYYMVEIKSILRILQACDESIPVLCFVDEVLRGTNTVERIAASTQILLKLKKQGALCFAATHDIELTRLLDGIYRNYHFEETVTDKDISFNYRLLDGPAVTRNAIKLLGLLNYDSSIVEQAEKMAADFLKTGSWEECKIERG
jgi:translation initiation factor 2 beta subunit (eIF-2beta)/eIF-5